METVAAQKNHKLILNNRKAGLVTGVLDVLSFNLNEILLETEQGMLMVRGTDLHVNRVNLEKGEIDLSGNIDSISYSDIHSTAKQAGSWRSWPGQSYVFHTVVSAACGKWYTMLIGLLNWRIWFIGSEPQFFCLCRFTTQAVVVCGGTSY